MGVELVAFPSRSATIFLMPPFSRRRPLRDPVLIAIVLLVVLVFALVRLGLLRHGR